MRRMDEIHSAWVANSAYCQFNKKKSAICVAAGRCVCPKSVPLKRYEIYLKTLLDKFPVEFHRYRRIVEILGTSWELLYLLPVPDALLAEVWTGIVEC